MRLLQYPALVEPVFVPPPTFFAAYYPEFHHPKRVVSDTYFEVDPTAWQEFDGLINPVYPDYFDARRQTDGDFENLFPVIVVGAPTYFAAIFPDSFDYRIKIADTETIRDILGWQEFDGLIFPEYPDFLDARSQNIPDNQPLVYNPPATINLKNWEVDYPDFLARRRDDSYFPSFFHLGRSLIVPITGDISLIDFFNLRVRLDVKKAVDSGVILADAGDALGTPVTFNKAFKDIDSIVLTVQETTNFQTVADFVDIPNPTGFKVYVYNAAGIRATKTVYWVARGII